MFSLVLFALLATLLELSCGHPRDLPTRSVLNPHKFRGLVPRQVTNGSLWNTTFVTGAGIVPLALATDKSTYYVTASVGNISFRLALDTASADLFIDSTACASFACRNVPRYPLTYQSPTFVTVNDNATLFNISFVDGTYASGYVAREMVKLSGLTSNNQAFAVVTNSNITLVDQVSGLMGLGFPRLSTIYHSVAQATPFFSSLAQQGLLEYPIFGVYLGNGTSGTLSLGAIDSEIVPDIGDIEWHYVVPFSPVGTENNVSSYMFWALELATISVNGSSFTPQPTYSNATANSSLALLDLGTPGIYGPYQDVSLLYSYIKGSRLVDPSGQWAIPCATMDTLSLSFGGRNFTLQPTDYLIGPTASDPNECLSWPRAMPPSSDGLDWQLGSAFLRTVYSVYSYGIDTKEPPIIGLYPLSNVTTPQNYSAVSAFFSSESATVATTLPNYLLSAPSYSTPPYAFNTSVPWQPGEIVSSGLATSTYSALLGTGGFSSMPTAPPIPLVSLPPTVYTFLMTQNGTVITETSTATRSSNTLGIPYGWNGACERRIPMFFMSILLSLSIYLMLYV